MIPLPRGVRQLCRWPLGAGLLVAAPLITVLASGSTAAAVRGQVTVDLDTGQVLSAVGAGTPTRPASLAKIMTLYLLLEALRDGTLSQTTQLAVSGAAAAQPATRLGLRAGARIDTRRAALALLVRSANDVAVVVAEALSGSEAAFVARMNAMAGQLGLRDTVFGNASGLPHAMSRTSARDMAALTRALYLRFPEHGQLFAATAFQLGGVRHRTHNALLVSYPGAIGLKTGFTCRAGYHAVAVAVRGDRRVIGVVLGAASPAARDRSARQALDRALAGDPTPTGTGLGPLDGYRPASAAAMNTKAIAGSCVGGSPATGRYFRASRWSVELEPYPSRRAALARARQVQRRAPTARPLLLPDLARPKAHRAGLTNLTRAGAVLVCQKVRASDRYCVVRPPEYVTQLQRLTRQLLVRDRPIRRARQAPSKQIP